MGTTATGSTISDSIEAAIGKETQVNTAGQADMDNKTIAQALILDNLNINSGNADATNPKDNETDYSTNSANDPIVSYPKKCNLKCRCSCASSDTHSCLCAITLVETHKTYLFDSKNETKNKEIEQQLAPYERLTEENKMGDFAQYYLFLRKAGLETKGNLTGSTATDPEGDTDDTTVVAPSRGSLDDVESLLAGNEPAIEEITTEDEQAEATETASSEKNPTNYCDRSFSIRFDKKKPEAHLLNDAKNKVSAFVQKPTATCKNDSGRPCYRDTSHECEASKDDTKDCSCAKVSELTVGGYSSLKGVAGDQITPHHMPSDGYMKHNVHRVAWATSKNRKKGNEYEQYRKEEGVSLNMQEARHEQTFTYKGPSDTPPSEGKISDNEWYLTLSPTNALLEDILNVRTIYSNAGQYTADVKGALMEVWNRNVKTDFPEMYKSNEPMSSSELAEAKNKVATQQGKNHQNSAEAAKKKALAAKEKQAELEGDLAKATTDKKKAQLKLEKDAAEAEEKYWNNQAKLKKLPDGAEKENVYNDMKAAQSSYYYYKGKTKES